MIELKNIHFAFSETVIESGRLLLYPDELTVLCGESGSGKTILLYEIGMLSKHKDIDYQIDDYDIRKLSEKKIAGLRRNEIGYVFQSSDLLENESVLENINHFSQLCGKHITEEDVDRYLSMMGLNISKEQKVKSLSGGERQRLAIICALLKETKILVLDEVTSALDSDREDEIFQLLQGLAKKQHLTIIFATHSPTAYQYADRVYEIRNKKVVEIKGTCKQMSATGITLMNRLPLQLRHCHEYVCRYMKKHFLLNLLILFMVIVSCVILSSINEYEKYYVKSVEEEAETLSYNEILIMDKYVDSQANESMYKELKQILDDNEIQSKLYPYFDGQLYYKAMPIKVIPYYENEKNDDLIAQRFDKKTGIAASYSIGYYLEEYAEEDGFLHLKNDEGKEVKIKPDCFFKKGVSFYQKENRYIAMSDQMIKELNIPVNYEGYILHTNSFHDLHKASSLISEYEQISELQDIYILNGNIKDASRNMNFLMGCVVALLSILLLGFYVVYYTSRKYEIAYLKANGYTNLQLTFLLTYENILRFIMACGIVILTDVFIQIVIFNANLTWGELILKDLGILGILILIPHIFSMFYIYHMNPSKIFRN